MCRWQQTESLSSQLSVQPCNLMRASYLPYKPWLLGVVTMLAVSAFANTAIEPVPRSKAWRERHAGLVAEAKKGGIDVLFLGDSITAFWRETKPTQGGKPVWDEFLAPLRAANFGLSGDRTQHILWRLRNGEGEGFRPKVVVLLIGTNNIGFEKDGVTPRNTVYETVEGVRADVREIEGKFPDAKILLLALFPRGEKDDPRRQQVAEVNRGTASLPDGKRVFWLDLSDRFLDADGNIRKDLMPDLLHPGLEGYRVWAAAMLAPLARLLE